MQIPKLSFSAAVVLVLSTTLAHAAETKFCSVIYSAPARSMTPVPADWTPADCINLARSAGSQRVQLGCMFDREPSGAPNKFSVGDEWTVTDVTSTKNVPGNNCGW